LIAHHRDAAASRSEMESLLLPDLLLNWLHIRHMTRQPFVQFHLQLGFQRFRVDTRPDPTQDATIKVLPAPGPALTSVTGPPSPDGVGLSKLVVDCSVVLRLVADDAKVPAKHKLLAPTLLRSQALSTLHEAVHAGKLSREVARERLARVNRLPIRLLGDAVLRRRAWELAEQLGWAETYNAEYVALTQLQGDAFVTLDRRLARAVKELVQVAGIEALVE